jgi:hypothetical protein
VTKVRYPTDAEIERGRKVGEMERQYDGKALLYRPTLDVLEIELVNGLRVAIPRKLVTELATVPVALLRKELRLGAHGEAIEIRSLDLDISVSGLIADLVGADWARRAGRIKSPAKAAAARANGRKGGRPRKKVA